MVVYFCSKYTIIKCKKTHLKVDCIYLYGRFLAKEINLQPNTVNDDIFLDGF